MTEQPDPISSGPEALGQTDVAIYSVCDSRFFLGLIALINSKTAYDVQALQAAGPNRYTTTVKSPDGTVTLPLTVTVEAQRIVCEIKTPAGTDRNVITPQGVKPDLQMK